MKKIAFIIVSLIFSFSTGFAQTVSNPLHALEHLKDFPNVRDFTLSANGMEAYLTLQSPLEDIAAIAVIRKKEDRWSEPELVPFTGKYRDIEPFLSVNNLRLYFASNRPLTGNVDTIKDFDIYYVEREDLSTNWSAPINPGSPVNTSNNEFYPSIAANGNIYFTSDVNAATSKDDLYFCKWENDHYLAPERLSDSINSLGYEYNAFVAPDESYLIFGAYNREDGFGSGDLYISYRSENDEWLKAINMGKTVNSTAMDYCPFVDHSNGTLYFTSKRSSMSNRNISSAHQFKEEVSKYENGFSRIYSVGVKDLIRK